MYELIDNFLNDEEFKSIERMLLSNEFPWYLNRVIDKKSYEDNLQFTHTVLSLIHI